MQFHYFSDNTVTYTVKLRSKPYIFMSHLVLLDILTCFCKGILYTQFNTKHTEYTEVKTKYCLGLII